MGGVEQASKLYYFVDHIHLYCNQHISTCLTRKETIMPQWRWTMDLACAKLDLPEMTPHVPSSHPSSDVPATRASWSVWDRRTHMLEMRLNPRGVSSPRNTQLSTESSPTGTIWRRSGTTASTTSSASLQRITQPCSPRLHSTPKPTVRR